MKTIDDFYNDQYRAMKVLAEHLKKQGYEVRQFTSLDGEETVVVEVEDEGEIKEYATMFERV